MIDKLEVKNFTIFRDAAFEFSPSLNVIIGDNGSGKTHLIKLLYSILSEYNALKSSQTGANSKQVLQQGMAEKLLAVFRPERLGRLATRKQGRERTEVYFVHKNADCNCRFSFATNSKTEVVFTECPDNTDVAAPIFFPAKELLTLYPKFISMYDEYYVQYDETYRNAMLSLGRPLLKGHPGKQSKGLIENLEKAIGGHIHLDPSGNSFYMTLSDARENGGEMEINLIAEGWRKIGMLTQVVLNGTLKEKGYLFWDEPEANMNPRLIKELAQTIFNLSKIIQVFIATHSLFLLRELEYLSFLQPREKSIRYISLNPDMIQQSYSTVDLTEIVSLDQEIAQEERVLSFRK